MGDVRDNPALSRFELTRDGTTAVLEYAREGRRVVLTHTEVPEALAGHGVGSALVRGALDLLRAEGAQAVPRCEFAAAWIARRPEYQDLVAP